MTPTPPANPKTDKLKKKTWSEVNRQRKEEKRKWKETKLLKKDNKKPQIQLEPQLIEIPPKELSTISIAVPGSILENAQSAELRTYLAGQIARAACIFQVDEIVVFDDYGDEPTTTKTSARASCIQFGRILQYLECPQYLRKNFFPLHKDLKFTGILNPLNAPHHLSVKEEFEFREGVVTNKPVKPGKGSIVNVGLMNEVQVDKLLTAGLRCTVRLLPNVQKSKKLKGVLVSPKTPRRETGVYWGYDVRIAHSLDEVFTQSPYQKGYDLTIGTSDKGSSIDSFVCPTYKHLLVVFGGLQGIEAALENDQKLQEEDAASLFDFYLNTVPDQGSKTIRTEEAILVSLTALRPNLNPENPPIKISNERNGIDNSTSKVLIHVNKNNNSNVDLSRFD